LKIDRLAQIPSRAASALYSTSGSGSDSSRARSRQAASWSRPNPRAAARGAPALEQLVDRHVLLGGAGLEHDPIQLVQAGVAADRVFEFAEGVVDFAAPPGERS
jgi:hypothetical protein